MRTNALLFGFFASIAVAACSSGGASVPAPAATSTTGGGTTPPSVTNQDDTWADGKALDGSVDIAAGVTVTIADGATIAVSSGVSLTIHGALVVKGHASLGGASWSGIDVASGGKLTADGLAITGADVAIHVESGGTATFDNGTIAGTPFLVDKGGSLSTTRSKVTAPDDTSNVSGSFTASYLDYDTNDQHGISAEDPSATVFIEDSTFHNSGKRGTVAPDILTSDESAKFHVAYSDVSGAHCGFHFVAGEIIEIDHVSVHGVTNGADLWGSSSTGKHTITSSNFDQLIESLDEANQNGAFTVDGCHLGANDNLASSSVVTITNPQSADVPDAKPR